jgi:hypothetical protein
MSEIDWTLLVNLTQPSVAGRARYVKEVDANVVDLLVENLPCCTSSSAPTEKKSSTAPAEPTPVEGIRSQ